MGGGASKRAVSPADSANSRLSLKGESLAEKSQRLEKQNLELVDRLEMMEGEDKRRNQELDAQRSKIASLMVEINKLNAGEGTDGWSNGESDHRGYFDRFGNKDIKKSDGTGEAKMDMMSLGSTLGSGASRASGFNFGKGKGGDGQHEGRDLTNRTPSRIAKQLSVQRRGRKRPKRKNQLPSGDKAEEIPAVVRLPRGGVYVWTKAGPIQFGIPPETVKDSMNMGLEVPTIFVVPRERFNMQMGVNVSEIEFPAFFNFFVRQKQMTLVTYQNCSEDLFTIMKEALDGPDSDQLHIEEEYSRFASKELIEARADHDKEMAYFREPRPGTKTIKVGNLIKFAFFNAMGECHLDEGVVIKDEFYGYTVLKDEQVVAAISDDEAKSCYFPGQEAAAAAAAAEEKHQEIPSSPVANSAATDASTDSNEQMSADNGTNGEVGGDSSSFKEASRVNSARVESETESTFSTTSTATDDQVGKSLFQIPRFGITVLGNSHGFDPQGSTSGFVVWINGQGIMVDPPPHSGELLKRSGIQPKLITATILTHCHADHDAGTIQKMITEDKVTLMTTKTVFNSLLRKYEGVSGLAADFLRQLVSFRPVFVEEPTYWGGASFRFFYSLHAIPCVGFEVAFEGKRIVYSADTFFEPEGLAKMRDRGILSKARCDALLNFPWSCDLVFHEAGVPPIHTPLSAFESVPEKYRKNIQLIHIGTKDQLNAESLGFKVAKTGVENTTVLIEGTQLQDTLKFLQLVASVDIFKSFPITQALELLLMSSQVCYEPGQIIAEKGSPGDKFMVIMNGEASVSFGSTKKLFKVGDYLGEISVITGEDRTATIVAETNCTIVEVDKYAFHYFLTKDKKLYAKMECLVRSRMDGSWHAIARNSVLRNLSAAQKTSLQAFLHIRRYQKGDVVWKKGDQAQGAVLLLSGKFIFEEVHSVDPFELLTSTRHPHLSSRLNYEEDNQDMTPFDPLSTGVLICDMFALTQREELTVTLVCDSDEGVLFSISQENVLGFLDANPMMMLALLGSLLVQ